MRMSSNRFMRLAAHCGTRIGGTKQLIVQKSNTIAKLADLHILSRAAT